MSKQSYRPSASLILAAQEPNIRDHDYDFKLLLIKRSPETAFAKDHCVFPGGVYDEAADENIEWLNYYHTVGITKGHLQEVIVHSNKRPSPLMTSGRSFSRDLSLRLTAIRETFEEVGLLLCRTLEELKNLTPGQPAYIHDIDDYERRQWQQRVHNDGRQFLDYCKYLNVVPDLWALSEWSVWRSAATAAKKYDTAYYFAALNSQPSSLMLEPSEVNAAMWLDPNLCLQQFAAEVIWLPSLLFYEITRIKHIRTLSALARYAHRRSRSGSTLLMPVNYRCDDAMVAILPGDSLYPARPEDCTETIVCPGAMKTLHGDRIHRIIIYDMYSIAIVSNISAWNDHIRLLHPTNQSSKL